MALSMDVYITACALPRHPLRPCAPMDRHPIAVVGDGNVVGNRVFKLLWTSSRERYALSPSPFFLFSYLINCRQGFGCAEAIGRIRCTLERKGTLSSPEMSSCYTQGSSRGGGTLALWKRPLGTYGYHVDEWCAGSWQVGDSANQL